MSVIKDCILIFFIFAASTLWSNGLDTNTIVLSSIYNKVNNHEIYRTQKCWFYESKNKLSIQDIITKDIPFEKLDISKNHTTRYKQHWLKFKIYNDYCDSKKLAIGTGQNNYVDIYLLKNDSIFYNTKCGFLEHPLKLNNSTSYFSEVPLPSHDTTEIIVECNNFLPNQTNPGVNVYNKDILKQTDNFFYTYINYYESIFFFGCVFFAFFFVLALYYYFRHQIYLSYLFYIFTLLIFAFFGLERVVVILHLLHLPPELYYYFHEPSLFLFSSSYGFFVIKILDIHKKKYPKLYWWITIMSYIILLWFLFLLCWIHFYDFKYHDAIFNWSIAIVQIYSIITFTCLFWVRSIYKRLILLGMGALLILGISTFVFDDIFHFEIRIFGENKLTYYVFLKLGFLIEMLFFAMALGKRTYIIEQERGNNYERYIHELESKSELEIKVNQFKNEALRAQINPHFLFNSLNAINSLVKKNEIEKASDYLYNFSKLFRDVLDQSHIHLITLEEELNTIKLYIDLEEKRLNNSFRFELLIDNRIELDNIKLPPLILQPYVENAIWHGLQNSEKPDKTLEINIQKISENAIKIDIYDNGIGREAAGKINKLKNNKKSHGLNITQERINIYNINNHTNISIKVEDAPNHKNNIGTLFSITITEQ
jgi:sensor histidine kinase YesM